MFQIEQLSIVLVGSTLMLSFVLIGRKLQHLERTNKPSYPVTMAIAYVRWINDYTISIAGKKHGAKLSAYIGSLFLYLFFANISGLFGISAPTANYSVTLALSLVSWLMIQITKLKVNGVRGYLAAFFKPFVFFVIPNIFSTVAPLISLSMRMFGNMLSGSIIMSLLYTFTGWLSGFVPVIGQFNFVALLITPVLHLYFDLFAGFIQAFLFISLTTVFVAVEFNDQ